ncbi:hypothetical protein BXZ70DRAFT_914585 [Cristinia sonorae]|uniref:Secreted protein n=1 Tax=Cristinia sonorae TaxID=1940300 RepID=A0A8K0V186_9AGAR|nr:hypothetical protein BXZ70DRAFT_914505 [Cristinia sonorae]KAH8108192.1 hypothetical protein BXZ70DRAFT_914585 [Cristinia sonorae]
MCVLQPCCLMNLTAFLQMLAAQSLSSSCFRPSCLTPRPHPPICPSRPDPRSVIISRIIHACVSSLPRISHPHTAIYPPSPDCAPHPFPLIDTSPSHPAPPAPFIVHFPLCHFHSTISPS